MRITNFLMHDLALKAMQDKQAEVFRYQQQVATGKKLLTPSDNPSQSANLVELSAFVSYTMQTTGSNANTARNTLRLTDVVLTQVERLIDDVKKITMSVRGVGSNTNLANSIAQEVGLKLDQLVGMANEKDGNGQHLFSGLSGISPPFVRVPATDPDYPVEYVGDQGQRFVQISQSINIAISDSGTDVFERIKEGNGTFVTSAGGGNTGAGVISAGSVVNQTDPNLRETVTITFDNPPTTFSVAGTGTGNPAGVAYTAGAPISYNGWNLAISGAPAAGDTFTVQASASKDLFSMFQDLVDELNQPMTSGADQARRENVLNAVVANLNGAKSHVAKIHTMVASRLSTVESVAAYGKELNVQYEGIISRITDVDYNEAISNLNAQRIQLEAAQRSFVLIREMSLFNFL